MSPTPRERLAVVSREYEIKANEYAAACKAAAKAKAAYTKANAIFKLDEKVRARRDDGEKMADVEAQTRADADEEIATLYEAHLIAAALEKSLYEKLRQLKEQNANGRTVMVDDREVDKIHAQGLSGAA
jgi:hypothetical protein